MKSENLRLVVEIENVTEAQAIAIEDMLATWVNLGGMGSSRWTSFYADGDGDFHPRITVNGKPAAFTALLTRDDRWSHREPLGTSGYRIDYDRIAWKLRD